MELGENNFPSQKVDLKLKSDGSIPLIITLTDPACFSPHASASTIKSELLNMTDKS